MILSVIYLIVKLDDEARTKWLQEKEKRNQK
jgi:hypothetical protein